jgi:hypothetical protein
MAQAQMGWAGIPQVSRLVLDITKTRDGRCEGSLTEPGTGGRQDFAGILELLAILEGQFWPSGHEDAPQAGARRRRSRRMGASMKSARCSHADPKDTGSTADTTGCSIAGRVVPCVEVTVSMPEGIQSRSSPCGRQLRHRQGVND